MMLINIFYICIASVFPHKITNQIMYHIKNIYFVLYITDKYNSKLVKKTTIFIINFTDGLKIINLNF